MVPTVAVPGDDCSALHVKACPTYPHLEVSWVGQWNACVFATLPLLSDLLACGPHVTTRPATSAVLQTNVTAAVMRTAAVSETVALYISIA